MIITIDGVHFLVCDAEGLRRRNKTPDQCYPLSDAHWLANDVNWYDICRAIGITTDAALPQEWVNQQGPGFNVSQWAWCYSAIPELGISASIGVPVDKYKVVRHVLAPRLFATLDPAHG